MSALLDEFGIGDAREREESWRYSRNALRALEQQSFATADASIELDHATIARFDWPQTRGRRAVFVNGEFSARYSILESGTFFSIAHERETSSIRFSDAGLLHLVFVNAGVTASRWRRNLKIDIDARGVEVVEHHVGFENSESLGALRSVVQLSENAEVALMILSDIPDSASLYRREQVRIGKHATYRATHVLFGGRFQRFDLDVELSNGSNYEARGLFALRGRQHVDVHLDVRHVALETRSDISWRGVADQRARGILRGALVVAEGADGTDAQLQTKNLLLSPHAEIDAQPVLEIYADDVKAAHGATVGQLDERALFYLRSRGIALADARTMLIAGFCRDALSGISNPDVRERFDAVLIERLPHVREVSA